ncbi:MAG: 2-C-methyl-D-erythritol 4-phosphate cytidylyltransferase [Burkholderiales bacterium]
MSNETPYRPRFFALIPCAGSGSRAGTCVPKQYHVLFGQPMVLHTLAAFAAVPRIADLLVVVSPQDESFEAFSSPFSVADCGGETRAQSVLNGLDRLFELGADRRDWVLVHDAARCLILPSQIEALIDACEHDPVGGLLAHRLADTLKHATPEGRVAKTLDRSGKWLAQTPQMFRLGALLGALQQGGSRVTDEAAAMEAAGHAPLLVAGSAQNFKVTFPEDFALAEAILRSRAA